MEGFQLTGSCLSVRVDLDTDARDDFTTNLRCLEAIDAKELTIDLSAIDYASSSYFGEILAFNERMKQIDRTLHLRISPGIAEIMEMLGLCKVLDVEVMEESGS